MKCLQFVAVAVFIGLTAACSTDPAVAKQKAFADGNEQFAQKRYSEAVVLYGRALQYDPNFAEARFKLAQAYDQLGDAPNAMAQFIRAADLMPGDADAQVKAGVFLIAGGAFEDAQARAQKALEVDPRNVAARMLLAQATAQLKNLNGAIEQIEQALRVDPTEPLILSTLADFRLAKGDTAAAEVAFKQAVAADPKSVTGPLGLARFYLATGKAADAEEWLKKALAIEPGNALANRTLAALYIRTNRLDDAEAPLKAAADAGVGPEAKLVLADYYASATRNREARGILESLLDNPLAQTESRLRLSALEWRENHRSEAHKWVDQIIAKDATNPQASLLKGRYRLAEGQPAQARDLLKTLVDANPQFVPARYWLGATYRTLGDNENARAQFTQALRLAPGEIGSTFQLAQLDLLDGQLGSAETRAREVIRADPRNGMARLTFVDTLVAAGKLPEALKEATGLATTLPKVPEPQIQLGRIYLKQGNRDAAERAFQRAIDLSNGRGDAVGGLVDTLIAGGKFADAHRTAELWLAKNPKEVSYSLAQARVYLAEKDPVKEEASLRSALDVDPGNVEASVQLTNLYIREQKLDAARGQLEVIVAKQPKAVWALTMIAQSLHLQNRTAEARQRYEHILEIDPHAAIAANNLAMMLLQEGQNLDRALELAQTARHQQPDNANFSDTLGSVYIRKGLGALAVPQLESSVHKDPSNPEFQYHLGQAYAQAGRAVEARAALRKALALSDHFDGVDDARKLLSGLSR